LKASSSSSTWPGRLTARCERQVGFLTRDPRGPEAVKNWWRQLFEEIDLRVEPEEYIDAGDAIVIVARQIARGHASGAEVEQRLTWVCGLRAGKVTYVDVFRTKAEALEAVGLRE